MAPFIYLASNATTDSQTVCLNSRIDTIVFYIGSGNNGTITVSGLPAGVTYNFNGYKLVITGAPTVLGTFNYTVATTGCNIVTFRGQINSQGQSLVLTSPATSNNQIVCFGNAIADITYSSGAGITAANVSVSGLPPGVSYAVASGIIKITGTPSQAGTYNYTVTATASICSGSTATVTASGTITIIANPAVTISSDYCAIPGRVKLTAVPSPAGSYQYAWSNGGITDTTSVDLIGTYWVTVTNSNGCKAVDTIPVSVELVVNGYFNQGNTGFTCPPLGNQRYIYVADSANYQQELLLYGRYGIGPNANNYNPLFYGKDHTGGNGNFMVVHGYAFASPVVWQEIITVQPNTNYYFSAWAMSLNDLGNNAQLKFTVNDSVVGGILTPPNHGNSTTSPDNWTRFYGTWNSGPATSAILKITNLQTSFFGNSFGLDDISFGALSAFINLASSPATDTQTVCGNTPITPVRLIVGSGGSPVISGLPAGVTSNYDGYNLVISGAPTAIGTFNYSIRTSLTCRPDSFKGQIISLGRTMTLSSPAATANQSICLKNPIANITFNTSGNISGVAATGLPAGLATNYGSGVFSISGIPIQSGVFNYTVTASGPSCPPVVLNGTITVNEIPTASISYSPGNTITCTSPSITLTASGGGTYSWSGGLGTNASVTINSGGTYKVVVTAVSGCKDSTSVTIGQTYTPGTCNWLGYSDDWSDSSNWCPGIPTSTTNANIPAGTPFNPKIYNAPASVKNLIIQNGALVVVDGQILRLAGSITSNGQLNVQNGSIELNGTSASQTINGSQFQNKSIKDLLLSNSSGIILGGVNDTLYVTNEVNFGNSNVVFNPNGNLVLKSNALGTARVGNMNLYNGTPLTGNRILGNVIVERYISQHSRAWEFLSTPTIGQTINQSWQEGGAPLSNNVPGYGTAITSNQSNATSLGFDFISPGGPSMKVYNSVTENYDGVPSTLVSISNDKGYMIYVRGDRSAMNGTSSSSTSTTLRTKGSLRTPLDNPPSLISVPADKYESVGNPYASAIDFSGLTVTGGMQQVFYLWDPLLTATGVNSAYGLGGFQTFVRNITGPGFIVSPGGGSYSNGNTNIESGAAFFVHTFGAPGTLSFSEGAKVSGSNVVFRPISSSLQQMKANLYVIYQGHRILLDGALSEFENNLSDSVDMLDARRIGGMSGENISLFKNGINLAVERSPLIDVSDTITYRLGSLRYQTYELEFIPSNFRQMGLTAYLKDAVLNTLTPVSLTDTTRISFTVSAADYSKTPFRFYMIFKHGRGEGNLPIAGLWSQRKKSFTLLH